MANIQDYHCMLGTLGYKIIFMTELSSFLLSVIQKHAPILNRHEAKANRTVLLVTSVSKMQALEN